MVEDPRSLDGEEFRGLSADARSALVSRLRAAILASWPGVTFRLDQIDRGAGRLTAFRKRFGRENEGAR